MTAPRHFLEVDDLDANELLTVLDLARLPDPPPVLAGKGVALLFEKPSARTRNSTEVAVFELGGHPVTMRGEEVGIDTRETAEDLTRTLACFHIAIAARVFDHAHLERMAAVSSVPVVNLLSDRGHPCQALADLLTLHDRWGSFEGRTLAWVGDGNNVCQSLIRAAALTGMRVQVATPDGYAPDPAGAAVLTHDPAEAVKGADAVFTDTWASMGQEDEAAARRTAFAGFTVDDALMAQAKADALFLHCLPAHRGEEVVPSVLDGPQSVVWPEAENRLHAIRGLFLFLFGTA
ncbi:MAG: ornithine carbamoyltransferase [Actinobacteria bacterium]|nr:ornithine carbamoyltransferase [Actinomycetota bacterium]MBV9254605.1 ornithine carbamoyltransferase [Actinomycetota bacterium]